MKTRSQDQDTNLSTETGQLQWHFMQRVGYTSNSDEFVKKCPVLHDPKVMLTHYSSDVLFSDAARVEFVAPNLDPIPHSANPGSACAN